jgi:hypothetical protein
MAEIVSRQAAKVAANTKMNAGEAGGKISLIEITSPATAAWAQNDTMASPVILPTGTKILLNGYVSNAAMGTSVTLDVGLRNALTGAEIDLDGIAAAVAVASAGRTVLNSGALLAAGVAYVTTAPSVIVATLGGANPTDDAQINIQVPVVIPG